MHETLALIFYRFFICLMDYNQNFTRFSKKNGQFAYFSAVVEVIIYDKIISKLACDLLPFVKQVQKYVTYSTRTLCCENMQKGCCGTFFHLRDSSFVIMTRSQNTWFIWRTILHASFGCNFSIADRLFKDWNCLIHNIKILNYEYTNY